jgi:hypothetical protein
MGSPLAFFAFKAFLLAFFMAFSLISLPQMKPGQHFHIDCPAKFAYGSASPYTWVDSDHIPKNSDLSYEVELNACTKMRGKEIKLKAIKKAKRKALKAKKAKGEPIKVEKKSLEDEK